MMPPGPRTRLHKPRRLYMFHATLRRRKINKEAHDAARSKNKAAQTSATVHVPRHSQEAQDQQRHGTSSAICMIAQDQAGGSRSAQDQHARQRAGTSGARSPGRDTAPSNIVRSPSTSRSSRRPPLPPTTPAEALARSQLLLDYPPTADKIDEWRATIQSLIQGCTNLGECTCSKPLSGGARPTASWQLQCHTHDRPRPSWWISGRSRPACTPACWHERGTVAWTGYYSF